MQRRQSLGETIKARRLSEGLTLPQLAQRLGISHSHLYQIEAGRVGRPGLDLLAALALYCGLTDEGLALMIKAPKRAHTHPQPVVDNPESAE